MLVADDAIGCGTMQNIKAWWDELTVAGPDRTAINITTEGRKHLGAALGSRSYLEQYVNGKVEEWVQQVTRLAEVPLSQPQACYAAFTYDLKHRWT